MPKVATASMRRCPKTLREGIDQIRTESEQKVEVSVSHVRDEIVKKFERLAKAQSDFENEPIAGHA